MSSACMQCAAAQLIAVSDSENFHRSMCRFPGWRDAVSVGMMTISSDGIRTFKVTAFYGSASAGDGKIVSGNLLFRQLFVQPWLEKRNLAVKDQTACIHIQTMDGPNRETVSFVLNPFCNLGIQTMGILNRGVNQDTGFFVNEEDKVIFIYYLTWFRSHSPVNAFLLQKDTENILFVKNCVFTSDGFFLNEDLSVLKK